MAYQPSSSQQRSLFCQCNKTPCVCWPSATTSSRPRARSQSRPQPLVQQPLTGATARPHYLPAQTQQLPSPHTPSYMSPSAGPHHSPNPAASPSLTVPSHYQAASSPLSTRSPQANTIQLHPLLKAQSILRTPESPSALRLRWDVRDPPATAIIHSQHEPEYLYEHPTSVAYATSPPVPYLLVACNDALPWLAPVHAREGSAGVTVRDVLEAISEVIHTQVDASMAQLLPTDEDRARLYQAYHNRIKRSGADNKAIIAVDWLGQKTLFVCLERDEALARKRVKEEHMWPYVFSLKLKMRKGALVSDA
ncbi:hypothetical protein RSOLAG1IB_06208 [Rhizoctonia solani AG-1 IB]|uniref:DUF6699 domain-containing protein n=1 Tax=Thanatephorus cucumeris (strain AG1-IB / isolate 7/3/14) TaxID=1108050 RepID=A0A0B7FAI7_THACB|nr:hypothetical protein RSOLAG1IB_06208 [Rhizoctonia solani AG-1 IB]